MTDNHDPSAENWIKPTLLVAGLYFLRMLGLFSVLPLLSVMAKEMVGGHSPLLLGLALGVYGLTQAVFQIPMGWLSDRFGRRLLLLLGYGLFLLGSLVCAQAESVTALIIGRAIQGAGAVSSVLLALLADRVSPEKRAVSMAIVGATIGIAFGLAVITGPLIASLWQLSGVFYATALLCTLALLIIAFGLGEPIKPQVQQRTSSSQSETSARPEWQNSALLKLDLSVFVLHFAQMGIWMTVPTLLVATGYSVSDHWYLYLITVGGGFVLALPLIRRLSKVGYRASVLAAFFIVLALSCLALWFVQVQLGKAAIPFLAALLVFFWAFTTLEAILPSLVTRLASPKNRGLISGIFSSSQFLGVFAGGLFSGWVVQHLSHVSLMWLMGLLLVVTSLVLVLKAPGKQVS